jgi:hypothetical protein
MYYHSYDVSAGRFKVGMASSKDGFNWQKEGVVFEGGSSAGDFDAAGAAACHVVSVPGSKNNLHSSDNTYRSCGLDAVLRSSC